MEGILQSLANGPGIETALVVSREGLVIEQAGRAEDVDTDLLAATAAEIYSSAEAAGERFDRGTVDSLLMETASARFVMAGINSDVFLLVLVERRTNLGLLRWEVLAAAEKLRSEL